MKSIYHAIVATTLVLSGTVAQAAERLEVNPIAETKALPGDQFDRRAFPDDPPYVRQALPGDQFNRRAFPDDPPYLRQALPGDQFDGRSLPGDQFSSP